MKSKLCAAVALMACLAPLVHAREVVDMAGRKVQVPEKIERVFAPSPYGAYMMYALAPELMTGLSFEMREWEKPYMPQVLFGLPVLGGGPRPRNPEAIARTNPQLLIVWVNENTALTDQQNAQFDKLGIPYVEVVADGMTGYPAAVRFLGKLLGREARAEEMAKRMERVLRDAQAVVAKVPANQRPKVFYAEGVDGLSTECDDSVHTQMLQLLGDLDVYRCHSSNHMGLEKVSLEQILVWQPDAIVAQEKMFVDKVYQDPAWQQVKAVKERKVYLVPRVPMNWFDRPPSFMRFMGLEWLMSMLYPNVYHADMVKETQTFYKTFLNATLSEQQARELLVR